MQRRRKLGSSIATSRLLDTPDSWLRQLVSGQYLDKGSRLNLFMTCKQLNEVVMQHSQTTTLHLEPLSRPVGRRVKALQVARRHAPRIRLIMRRWGCKSSRQGESHDDICKFFQTAARKGATDAVTELQLKAARLNTILAPTIGQACKNLTRLSIHQCAIDLSSNDTFSNNFPNLQSLELDSNTWGMHQKIPRKNMQRMCSQLKGLTALRSLTVAGCLQDPDGQIAFRTVNVLAMQLTYLSLNLKQSGVVEMERDLQPVKWLQLRALQHLQLTDVVVHDDGMRVLLQMPCLTHLEVEFNLQESFAGQPCRWQELVCPATNVHQLAYLPLHPSLLLKVGVAEDARQSLVDMKHLNLLRQAIPNVQKAKALEWGNGGLMLLNGDVVSCSELAEWLVQALPFIKGVRSLWMHDCSVNRAVMEALCEFVQDRADGPCVKFGERCKWEVLDAMTLVQQMPHNSTIECTVSVFAVHVQQFITKMCSAAQCKLTLRVLVSGGMQHVCEQRIRAAMQQCKIEVLSLSKGYDNVSRRGNVCLVVQARLSRLA